jgi:hypothetical protein
MPPSVVLWPARLWPPPADGQLQPAVAGQVDHLGDLGASAGRTIGRRPRSYLP